jgi:LPXTG-motif cell wall-anchored protein
VARQVLAGLMLIGAGFVLLLFRRRRTSPDTN